MKTLKQFLRPSPGKIAVFVLLFAFSLLASNPLHIEDKGLPLSFLDFAAYGPSTLPSGGIVDYRAPYLNLTNLIIDITFWYLLSCCIVFAYWHFLNQGNRKSTLMKAKLRDKRNLIGDAELGEYSYISPASRNFRITVSTGQDQALHENA